MKEKTLNLRTEAKQRFLGLLCQDYGLTEREVVAMTLYPLLTMKEISTLHIFQVSGERVRQIISKAIRKIEHPARKKTFWKNIKNQFWKIKF